MNVYRDHPQAKHGYFFIGFLSERLYGISPWKDKYIDTEPRATKTHAGMVTTFAVFVAEIELRQARKGALNVLPWSAYGRDDDVEKESVAPPV